MYKFYDLIIIILTSFIGAYGLIKGICICISDMPTEIELYYDIINDDFSVFTWYLILMIILYLVCFGGGIVF